MGRSLDQRCGTIDFLKHHTAMRNWNQRFGAAGIHPVISLGMTAFVAVFVFGVWYRHPTVKSPAAAISLCSS